MAERQRLFSFQIPQQEQLRKKLKAVEDELASLLDDQRHLSSQM